MSFSPHLRLNKFNPGLFSIFFFRRTWRQSVLPHFLPSLPSLSLHPQHCLLFLGIFSLQYSRWRFNSTIACLKFPRGKKESKEKYSFFSRGMFLPFSFSFSFFSRLYYPLGWNEEEAEKKSLNQVHYSDGFIIWDLPPRTGFMIIALFRKEKRVPVNLNALPAYIGDFPFPVSCFAALLPSTISSGKSQNWSWVEKWLGIKGAWDWVANLG